MRALLTIMGSLEAIGNPTGLINNMLNGLKDFIMKPYYGMK
jgi:hypothetical protein